MVHYSDKVFSSASALAAAMRTWQDVGNKVVFTNGCFDLIHIGHIHFLSEARSLGDRLVVALNSDLSVSNLKGSHRPINKIETRLAVMASFMFVDAVIVFEELNPYDLIKVLLPNILVKGGDWSIDKIVGSDLVLANGGEVRSLKFLEGHSTTALAQSIVATHKENK